MPQDAEPGTRNRAEGHPLRAGLQLVLAVAKEGEAPVGQPGQELGNLGRGIRAASPLAFGRQHFVSQRDRPGVHAQVVLDRDPDIAQHPAQVIGDGLGLAAG